MKEEETMSRPIAPKTSHAKWSLFAVTTAMIIPVVALATSFNEKGLDVEALFSLKLFGVVALLALIIGILLDKRERQHASPFVPHAFFQAEDIEAWSETFFDVVEGTDNEPPPTSTRSPELYEPGRLWGRLSFTPGYLAIASSQNETSSLEDAA
jgi:hypothetical protein